MIVNFTWLWPNTEITKLSGEQVYLGSWFQSYHHTWHIQFSLLLLGQWERCGIMVGPHDRQQLNTWQLEWEEEREEGTAVPVSPARGLLQWPDFLSQGSTFSKFRCLLGMPQSVSETFGDTLEASPSNHMLLRLCWILIGLVFGGCSCGTWERRHATTQEEVSLNLEGTFNKTEDP